MVVVVNRLQAPDEASAARIEQGFRHASGMTGVPGCVRFELWKAAEGGAYDVVTHWRSREDYEAWRGGEHFRKAHGDTSGTERVRSQLVVYDVLIERQDPSRSATG